MTVIINIAVILFIIVAIFVPVLIFIAIINNLLEHKSNAEYQFRVKLVANIHNQIKEHGFYAVLKEFSNMLDDGSNRNKWFDDQMEVLTVRMTSSEVFEAEIIVKYKDKEIYNKCIVDCSGEQSEITLETIK